MYAAVYYENGGPDVLRYEQVPDPKPGPTEVLVRVEGISIEGGDTLNRLGGPLANVPHVVGYQCAGTVVEAGDQVSGIKVGDRVVTLGMHGSHAELRVADSRGYSRQAPRAGLRGRRKPAAERRIAVHRSGEWQS